MPNFKTNSLFGPGPNVELNACVGDNGGPYDFFDYALGYFKAVSAIVDGAERRDIPTDIAVYPAVYCLRHGIELYLKHLARLLPFAFGEPPQTKLTHKLSDNWNHVKAYLKRHPAFGGERSISGIDWLIGEVLDFDPNGEVFRFPESRGGGPHLNDARIINLGSIRDVANAAAETFSRLHYSAEGLIEARRESGRVDA